MVHAPMKRPLLASLALALLCSPPVRAAAVDCPDRETLAPLLNRDGLFLGELHGSVEVPALVGCLVRTLLAEAGGRRLTVALEVPRDALDEAHPFWRGQDGRASQAMVGLLRALKSLQAQQRLDLIGFAPPEAHPDQAAYEAAMARELDRTPPESFLIALAGNFHASGGDAGFIAPTAGLRPAGALLPRRMAHVLVAYREASESWFCMGSDCKVHALKPARSAAGKAPGLHALGENGYDHVFVLPRQTASPPAHAAPEPRPGASP